MIRDISQKSQESGKPAGLVQDRGYYFNQYPEKPGNSRKAQTLPQEENYAVGYHLIIDGFEGQDLEVQPSILTSGAKLLVNGNPAPKGPKLGQMLLRRDDGREVAAVWKPMLWDIPQLIVDGKTIAVVDRLPWYDWVWCCLPVILIALGGGLGAVCGFPGLGINITIFRLDHSRLAKYVITGMVSMLCGITYLILGILLLPSR
jgi:hypothetical protein